MNEERPWECFRQVEHIRGFFLTHILHNGQPSRGCGRNTFEVMTNVHPPNRFEHRKKNMV